MSLPKRVAQALLDVKAVGFAPREPITFKSGLLSPVYVDTRRLPFSPPHWHVVMDGLQTLISDTVSDYDVIAGVETGSISHSAVLGYGLHKPSVFVRKQAKAHGMKNLIEGGDVEGKRAVLIEDLVTTGGSSLAAVQVLRDSGAVVDFCFAIVSYGLQTADTAFGEADVNLHTLTSFDDILEELRGRGDMSADDLALIQSWQRDPFAWGQQYQAMRGHS